MNVRGIGVAMCRGAGSGGKYCRNHVGCMGHAVMPSDEEPEDDLRAESEPVVFLGRALGCRVVASGWWAGVVCWARGLDERASSSASAVATGLVRESSLDFIQSAC